MKRFVATTKDGKKRRKEKEGLRFVNFVLYLENTPRLTTKDTKGTKIIENNWYLFFVFFVLFVVW